MNNILNLQEIDLGSDRGHFGSRFSSPPSQILLNVQKFYFNPKMLTARSAAKKRGPFLSTYLGTQG